MSSFQYNIPAGQDIGQVLQFSPIAVVVSNFSPYYIYFPDAQNFCPPWTNGAVIPLAHATQARAIWSNSPFGPQSATSTPYGYNASLVFTDDEVAVGGGTTIPDPFQPSLVTSPQTTPPHNPDVNQSSLPVSILSPSYTIPLYWSNSGYNESYDYLAQRQLDLVIGSAIDIPGAGPHTIYTNVNDYQRIFWAEFSVAVRCHIVFDYSVWGAGLWVGNIDLYRPKRIDYTPNGFNLNGGIA